MQISDPVSESILSIPFPNIGANVAQIDLAMHNGIMYAYAQHATVVVGKGNVLWNLHSAVPYVELEWEAYQPTSNEFPSLGGQCCIFSDGTDLIVIGFPDGTTVNEIGMWKINFDGSGNIVGKTDIIDQTLGFRGVPNYEISLFYASRDIESELGVIKTQLHMSFYPAGISILEGTPIHSYQWNGAGNAMTYLGVWGDRYTFDLPSYQVGGGARTFSNVDELDFTVTNVTPAGFNLDVTYVLDGSAAPSGVAMCVKYNNLKDSPLSTATVTPIINGVTNGNYITELSTGESGVFRWDIAADGISPGDVPNISAFLIRTL